MTIKKRTAHNKSNTQEFILKASHKHNNVYDYSKVAYITAKTKIIIICPIHGNFLQIPNDHLNGLGCAYCKAGKMKNNSYAIAYTKDEYVKIANLCHNNFYSYEKSIFSRIRDKITIICPNHGDFEQRAGAHTRNYKKLGNFLESDDRPQGCPKCAREKQKENIFKSFL